MNRIKVRKGELAHVSVYGNRQEDGSIVLGHTGDTRIVDEWPEKADLDGDYFTYRLEYVQKQMADGEVKKFYLDEIDEMPNEPGQEWGNYL